MITDKDLSLKITLVWLTFAWVVSYMCLLFFPNFFNTLNDQGVDQIQRIIHAIQTPQTKYNDVIVHVDLNNSSLDSLKSHHPDRGDHAQVIRNLSLMGVSVQMLDFVYAGTTLESDDKELIHAVDAADSVLVGMALRMVKPGMTAFTNNPQSTPSTASVKINAISPGSTDKYRRCANLLPPLDSISTAAAMVGYLTLAPDNDGVFRRLPLIVRCADDYYPSFALAAVSQYLGVSIEQIEIKLNEIRIADAQFPGETSRRDLIIPVDSAGNLRIHFVGPWGSMLHYQFADILFASRDQDAMEIWGEELSGKIVLISDVTTGAGDMGRTPLDISFPLSGVHSNAVHTMLTESFLKKSPWTIVLLTDVVLFVCMMIFSLQFSAVLFTSATIALSLMYIIVIGVTLFSTGVILPIVQPLIMILAGTFSLHMASSVVNTRTHAKSETARKLAERDLEIGHRIQSSFLPEDWPQPAGWQIAADLKPARQVSGDFFDLFKWGDGRYITVVIADVCDKGVGAALFMALIRSLIRAFATQNYIQQCDIKGNPAGCSDTAILDTICLTNNYIENTHGDTGMFATLFLGILEPDSGRFRYVNCGHEPPWLINQKKAIKRLKPTGPALGIMPDSLFKMGDVVLNPGSAVLAFTDGLTESESSTGEAFGRERLSSLVKSGDSDARTMVRRIIGSVADHTFGQPPFDDITVVAIQRMS